MGEEHDDHWSSFCTSRNGAYREVLDSSTLQRFVYIQIFVQCSESLFNGKKSYQSLKGDIYKITAVTNADLDATGLYERNLNIFKAIFKFESYCNQANFPAFQPNGLDEATRLREYDRRLVAAKSAHCDIGNLLNASLLDVWNRYVIFNVSYDGGNSSR